MPTAERPAEQPHAKLKYEWDRAPHSTMASLSFRALRHEDMRDDIERDPQHLQHLADLCEEHYHPLKTAKLLGIFGHPDLQGAVCDMANQGMHEVLGSTMVHMKAVKSIVYHLDLHSRFQDQSGWGHNDGPQPPDHPSGHDGGNDTPGHDKGNAPHPPGYNPGPDPPGGGPGHMPGPTGPQPPGHVSGSISRNDHYNGMVGSLGT